MKLKRPLSILFLFSLFHTLLFGCATCQIMQPTVQADATIFVQNGTLKRMHFVWQFDEVFTQELFRQYDKNRNNKLEPKEIEQILIAHKTYMRPKHMLMQLHYGTPPFDDLRLLTYTDSNHTLIIDEQKRAIYEYDILLDTPLEHNAMLQMVLSDDEEYFTFAINSVTFNPPQENMSINNYMFTSSMVFNSPKTEHNSTPLPPQAQPIKESAPTAQKSTWVTYLESLTKQIKELMQSIKTQDNSHALWLLLGFAFIYGVVHAMGPGHGKTIVASYFLSQERSYAKALGVALTIGVVHTFSAFVLTALIYYVLDALLAHILNETVFYTSLVSALLIIAIALYLLSKKIYAHLKDKKSVLSSMRFSTAAHQSSCGCSMCKAEAKTTDAGVIIAAGIIPCPGTVTLFIFALSMGLFSVGLGMAFVMSMGMSLVIYVWALFSVLVRKKTTGRFSWLKTPFEFVSLTVILLLGIALLVATLI